MAHLFISYARDDGSALAQELKRCLEELGHTVFLDVDDIHVGEKWETKLREQVAQTDALLALVTPLAKDSPYVYQEFEQAKAQNKLIIPVVFANTALPGYLQQWNAIFIKDQDWQPIQRDGLCSALLKIEYSIQNLTPPRQLTTAPQPSPMPVSRRAASTVYPLISGVLAVLLLISLLLLLTSRPADVTPEPTEKPCSINMLHAALAVRAGQGKILAPANCLTTWPANVPLDIVGTYSQELENKVLWVLVFTDGKYWPQAIDYCRQPEPYSIQKSNGVWYARFNLGKSAEQFDVILMETDTGGEADTRFRNWMATACTTNDYPGIPQSDMPTGLYELDSITMVTR